MFNGNRRINFKKFYFTILFFLILLCNTSCFKNNIIFDVFFRPTFSPDGNSILFSPNLRNRYEIILYNLRTKTVKLLTPDNIKKDEECISPVFSHSGEKIAFIKSNKTEDNNEVCIMKSTGGGYTQITYSNHYNFEPIFSMDDKTIFFLRSLKLKNETTGIWIYSIDIETRLEEKITDGYFMIYGFSVSNDNKYLIYSTDYSFAKNSDRNQHVIKFDIEKRKEEILLNDKVDIVPCLSNNNKKIIMYVKNFNATQYKNPPKDGFSHLIGFYSMNIDGSDFTFLKNAYLTDAYLVKSYDDKKFLFIENDLKEYDIETNEIREIDFNWDEIYKAIKR